MAPVDDRPVWSVVCFFVDRAARRSGATSALLRAAVEHAGRRGARIVEGYPLDARGKRLPDTFAWFGLASAFRKAGFREAARRSPTRPVMRRLVARTARGGRPPGTRRVTRAGGGRSRG
jgi:GNAT superfamily N-acetyltransferase